ncbi:terminase large subunit [Pseudonocardiaceae bacterium YIM PH 21723]|nr:terminase large subunit [Pseudonocardiaceae bacterium YIM PH 21723]
MTRAASRVAGWPPRILTKVPAADIRRGDGPQVTEFIEGLCSVTRDTWAGPAGEPLRLRPWQATLNAALFARRPDGRRRHRVALVGMPRKNGKSGLGAGYALEGLFECRGAEVLSCAGDREQARIVFADARRMVEASPDLSAACKVYRDAIEVVDLGSVYRCLSAEAYTKEGLNPTRVLFDEVHVQPNDELWNVMALAMGARLDPLLLGITTAGVKTDSSGQDSLCYRLYQYGSRVASGEVDDPTFFLAWWGAPEGADHRDPKVWKAANPAYGDLINPEDFAAAVKQTPEAEYRTKRMNMWVSTATAWLPAGTWEACADPDVVIPDGAEVCLGFDGSFNNDSTALTVASCTPTPHIDVVACWERPTDAARDWAVPVLDVEDAIRAACRRWQVREIVCDPARWARTYQILEGEGLPIVEYPQTPARMTPATARFYEAVLNQSVTHSGDPRLARHLANCVLKTDSRGARITKENRFSNRKIDLAVSAVMALDRASQPPEVQSEPAFFAWNDL